MADQFNIDELVIELRAAAKAMKDLSGTGGTGPSSGKKDTDRLIQALARLGEKFDKTAKSQVQRDKDIQDFVKEVDDAVDSVEAYAKAAEAQKKAADELAAGLQEAARLAERTAEQAAAEAARDRQIERQKQGKARLDEIKARQHAAINLAAMAARAQLDEIAQSKTLQARMESLGDTISDRFGTDVVKTQMAMIKLEGAVKKVQQSASELTSAFVRGIGDLAMSMGSFATDIGDGAKSFTQFNGLIDSVTNALGEMAKAIPFAGEAISGAMKLTAEGAKFVLDQLQKTADSFNELGSVGALTAGGLEEFRKAQIETGVSLDVYTKAIAENSATLARFGGTVGIGTQKFTKVLAPLTNQGSKTSAELRRLGFTLADISEATGGYLSLQTQLGRAQRKDQAQLTQGSLEYAKELDLLAKLTGQSRKDIQAQQEAAMSEPRFRAVTDQLAEMGPEGEKAAETLRQLNIIVGKRAGPELAQALRDSATEIVGTSEASIKGAITTGGELVNIVGRIKREGLGAEEAYNQLIKSLGGGNFEMQRTQATFRDVSDTFVGFNEVANAVRGGPISVQEAQEIVAKQTQEGTDALTDSTVKAQQEMEILSIQIQALGMRAMPQATKAIEGFTKVVNKFVKEVSEDLGIEALATGNTVVERETQLQQQAAAIAEKEKKLAELQALAKKTDVYKRDAAGSVAGTKEQYLEQGITGYFGNLNELGETTEKAHQDYLRQIRELSKQIKEQREAHEEATEQSKVLAVQEQQQQQRRAGGPGAAAQPAGGAQGGQPPTVRSGGGGPPTGAMTPDQLFNFMRGTGSQAHFEKLDPGFRQALVSMAQEYNQLTGRKLTLNSAFRSPEEQAGVDSGGRPKGEPGRSKHNFGMAADLNSDETLFLEQQGLLAKYGFKSGRSFKDPDPPHIYMRDGGVIPARQGGTRVVAGEAGQNEAFVPLPDGRRIPVVLENFDIQDLVDAIKGATKGPGARDARAQDISRSIVDAITPLTQSFEQAMAETTSPINSMVTKLQAVTQGAVRTPGSGAGVMDTGAMLGAATQQLSVEEKITKLKERARSTEEGARIGARNDANMGLTTQQKLDKLKSKARSTEEGARIGAANDANMRMTTEQKLEKLKSRARSTEEGARIGARNDANMGLTTQQKLDKLKSKARSTEEGARIGARNDANMSMTTEQKFERLQSKKSQQSSVATAQHTFDQVNGKVPAAMSTLDGMDFESLTTSIIDDSFGDLNEQIRAVDLDGTDMIGEMISRPMQAFADVSTAGLGGLPENPAAMTGMTAPAQSLIAPNVTSALTDIENVFAKAGMTPGSTPTAAAAAPALGAAPEMAAGGMTEMMSQLTKLVDLQSRSNKISEKLVRVSTN